MDKRWIVLILLLIGFLVLLLCINKNQRDNYTRTCLTDSTNARFVRTPVDYAMKDVVLEGEDPIGWQRNPHWIANPHDKLQPLGFGPVDFYPDERKIWNETVYDQYSPNSSGCGNGEPYLVNDNKTRTLLREVGDEGLRRILDNMTGPEHGPETLVPPHTELTDSRPDPYTQSSKLYGGPSYFFRDTFGS